MTTQGDLRLNWFIAIAISGWLLYLLAPVLTPFVAAALLAYIGDPLADRLERLNMPRTVAVVLVFLLTFLFLGALVLLLGPLVRSQVSALFQALPEIAAQVELVWLPQIADILNIEPDSDVGIGPFLARYSEMAGSWGGINCRSNDSPNRGNRPSWRCQRSSSSSAALAVRRSSSGSRPTI